MYKGTVSYVHTLKKKTSAQKLLKGNEVGSLVTMYLSSPHIPLQHKKKISTAKLFRSLGLKNIIEDKRRSKNSAGLYLWSRKFWGFPGGAVVESLPANAGDTGSSPGLGRSHMLQSNWAREPQLLSLRSWSLCSATREATIMRGPRTAMKSGPRSSQLEKALAQQRRPNAAKINK